MQVGDRVKYNFREKILGRDNFTYGEILFLNNERIIILSEDKSIKSISVKEFSNLEVVDEDSRNSGSSNEIRKTFKTA